jgi:4-hydroxythreonine-4-phosphate dehydrogenase
VTDARPIAVAIGDPNGIGPEIAVKAAAALKACGGPPVTLVGDAFVIRHYAERLGVEDDDLAMLDVGSLPTAEFAPGRICAAAGRATVDYCARALALAQDGHARAIVGCPHSETAIAAAGIPFSGYPSLIARLTGQPEDRVFLMLVGGGLRIVHATLHERLADALARLGPGLVEAAARTAADALQRLGLARPRIGLFGVNPHAGEGGLFGADDEHVTVPAAAALRQAGLEVEGPAGADVLLGQGGCDLYVAMYHDQGHIPVKLLAGRTASALTIGAGVLFSTVGHGSAFDIAGRGVADPEATLRTLRLLAGAA